MDDLHVGAEDNVGADPGGDLDLGLAEDGGVGDDDRNPVSWEARVRVAEGGHTYRGELFEVRCSDQQGERLVPQSLAVASNVRLRDSHGAAYSDVFFESNRQPVEIINQ